MDLTTLLSNISKGYEYYKKNKDKIDSAIFNYLNNNPDSAQGSISSTAKDLSNKDNLKPITEVSNNNQNINQNNFSLLTPEQQSKLLELMTISTDTTALKDLDTSLKNARELLSNIKPEDYSKYYDTISSLRGEDTYKQIFDEAIAGLQKYASGESDVDKTIANRYLSAMDAAQAATRKSIASQLAARTDLPESTKLLQQAELERQFGSSKAQLIGELAQQAKTRAYEAQLQIASLANTARQLEETKFQFDISKAAEMVNRDINRAIALGEIDVNAAKLDIEKFTAIMSSQINDKKMQIEAIRTAIDDVKTAKTLQLTSEELNLKKQEIELEISELKNRMTQFYQSAAINQIMNLYDIKGDSLSVEDVKNDEIAMIYLKNMYKELTNSENVTDEFIQSMLINSRPEWIIEKETQNRKVNDLISWLKSAGYSDDVVNNISKTLNIVIKSGGTLTVTPDGKLAWSDGTGQPITWFDEYGNEVVMALDIDANKNVVTENISLAKNDIINIVGETTFNRIINDVNSGLSFEDFKDKLNTIASRNKLNINYSDDVLLSIYKGIKEGKIKVTSAGYGEEITKVNESDIFSQENIDIFKEGNIEDVIKVYNLWRNELITNPASKEIILNNIKNNKDVKQKFIEFSVSNVSPAINNIRAGDVFIDDFGNVRIATNVTIGQKQNTVESEIIGNLKDVMNYLSNNATKIKDFIPNFLIKQYSRSKVTYDDLTSENGTANLRTLRDMIKNSNNDVKSEIINIVNSGLVNREILGYDDKGNIVLNIPSQSSDTILGFMVPFQITKKDIVITKSEIDSINKNKEALSNSIKMDVSNNITKPLTIF